MSEPTYQSRFMRDPVAQHLTPLVGQARNQDRVRAELTAMAASMLRHGLDPLRFDFSQMAGAVDDPAP